MFLFSQTHIFFNTILNKLKNLNSVNIPVLIFLFLFSISSLITPGEISYFDFSFLSSGGLTLALAAVGEVIVIISGGFDLSAGAVVSFVNAILSTNMHQSSDSSVIMWTLIGIGAGSAIGMINGILIGFFRFQPIVVTLAVMFIVKGFTLLIMSQPGGNISPSLTNFYLGDLISGVFPNSLLIIVIVILIWKFIKMSHFGIAVFAIGCDEESSKAVGVNTALVKFFTYTIAGGFYGFAGVFVSAQTGSGDPLIGDSLLLSVFAAVVIGGARLGGGKGSVFGTIIGAYILIVIVNLLLGLNISAYFSTIAEGLVIIVAVMFSSKFRFLELKAALKNLMFKIKQRKDNHKINKSITDSKPNNMNFYIKPNMLKRNNSLIKYSAPSFFYFLVVILMTYLILGNVIFNLTYWNSLFVLSSFLIIIALGQGTVILTGGLDLSIPWMITISGILIADISGGLNQGLFIAIPVVFIVAFIVGAVNGFFIAVLGLSPIVITLSMNGILQGAALLYTNGTPSGVSPKIIKDLMTSQQYGFTPIVYLIALFILFGIILLAKTVFGRYVYATGSNERVARLSGVPTKYILIKVYILSSFTSAIAGILMTGFSGQASLGMGDDFLLPSIATVIVGGALITGGRGYFIGMVGGALLLTSSQILLVGTALPYAFRLIVFGLIILLAIITLKEKSRF